MALDLLLAAALFVLPQLVAAQPAGNEAPAPVHVAVVADLGPEADTLARQVETEIKALFAGRRKVRFTRASATDPWTPDAARAAYEKARSGRPDALVLVGPITATAVCSGDTPPNADVPTIAVSPGSGLLVSAATARNCVVAEGPDPSGPALASFRRLTPIDRVQVIVDARVANAVPGAAEQVRRWGETAGVSGQLVPLAPDASADAVPAEGPGTAVYLDHLDRWGPADVQSLTRALTARGVPVFAADPSYVETNGALAALDAPGTAHARHAALALEGQLTGSPPPVADASTAETPRPLVVNRSVAAAQGLTLPWSLQVDARLVGPTADSVEPTSLAEAMRTSIRANLQLKAERQRTRHRPHGERGRSRRVAGLSAAARGVLGDLVPAGPLQRACLRGAQHRASDEGDARI